MSKTKLKNKVIYLKDSSKLQEVLERCVNDPVIFIEDTKQVYTCGNVFDFAKDYQDAKVTVTQAKDGVVVNVGNQEYFKIKISGDSLSLQAADNERDILFQSSALVNIPIEEGSFLYWDSKAKKLCADKYFDKESFFGGYSDNADENITDKATIEVPGFKVNEYGIVTGAKTFKVTTVDKNVLQEGSRSDDGDYPLLHSSGTGVNNSNTSSVYKTGGVTYNPSKGQLNVTKAYIKDFSADTIKITGGLVLDGDLDLGGNVINGQATPVVHISTDKAKYGGASVYTYGHVKLQDELKKENGVYVVPEASSDNTSESNGEVVNSVAASPLMVYNAYTEAVAVSNKYTDEKVAGIVIAGGGVNVSGINTEGQSVSGIKNLDFKGDFVIADDGGVSISWYKI